MEFRRAISVQCCLTQSVEFNSGLDDLFTVSVLSSVAWKATHVFRHRKSTGIQWLMSKTRVVAVSLLVTLRPPVPEHSTFAS